MVVEYDERKWFLNSVGPEFAHVMIIAIVKEVDVRGACGIAAILDNAAFTLAVFFGAVN